MVWCDIVWYDVMWYDVMWCGIYIHIYIYIDIYKCEVIEIPSDLKEYIICSNNVRPCIKIKWSTKITRWINKRD